MMRHFGLVSIIPLLCGVCARSQTIPWGGGPVIQNAKVVAVYWGSPDPNFSASIDRFYSQLAESSYLGRLSEYSTRAVSPFASPFRSWFGNPAEQVIGRGIFAGGFVLGPSEVGHAGNVETTDIGPRLDHEIHIGHLPAPDKNTVYMVHFAPGWAVYLGTNLLGIPVGYHLGHIINGEAYCAYHAAYYSNYTDRAIVYGAVPHQASLGNCVNGLNPVDAETVTASHELVESITDPGSAVVYGGFLSVGISSADQAWRSPAGPLGLDPQEIADACAGQSTRVLTSADPGDNYLITKIWSNVISNCVGLQPIGNFDGIADDNAGNSHVRGWTLDPDNPGAQIEAHVYIDGPYPYGKGFATIASIPRVDVNVGTGYSGNHAFDFVIPAEFRDGNSHSVYVYGIGTTAGNNGFLGSVPISYNSSMFVQAAVQPVMIGSGQTAGGQCLDVTGGSSVPGTPIQLFRCYGSENQRFSYHSDSQELRAYRDTDLCLDTAGGAGNNGARLVIWPCTGASSQKWTFNITSGEIRGLNGKCVDANARSTANGTAIQLWDCNRGPNQYWFRK